MVPGYFVGLFLRGIAQQATETRAAMVAELGGLALARKRSLGRSWQDFFCTEGRWGQWRAKLQNLVGFGTVVRFRAGSNL